MKKSELRQLIKEEISKVLNEATRADIFAKFNENQNFDDDDDVTPIGVDNLSIEGDDGLVHIFSPLESDMVEDWNNDAKIQKFIKEKRLFLGEIKYDEWSIYGINGDKEVRNYIIEKYSW